MRTFLIPGFGEEPWIFDPLLGALPGTKILIGHSDLIGAMLRPDYHVQDYAHQLIQTHDIGPHDLLIGHSMGGWVAYAIKQVTGSRVVQIASWTDPAKVVSPVENADLIYWAARNHLYFNRYNKALITWMAYRGKPSAPVFGRIFQNLIDSPTAYVVNQLRIIFAGVTFDHPQPPELRIHSQADTIVRTPDEPFHEVPGDHFNLYTHPEEVKAILRSEHCSSIIG